MKTCKTCKWWQEGKEYPECNITRPVHPGTMNRVKDEAEAVAVYGHAVRECKHPKVLFFQRPEIDGAAVVDGSEYKAALMTAEQFGCIHHEPAANDASDPGDQCDDHKPSEGDDND